MFFSFFVIVIVRFIVLAIIIVIFIIGICISVASNNSSSSTSCSCSNPNFITYKYSEVKLILQVFFMNLYNICQQVYKRTHSFTSTTSDKQFKYMCVSYFKHSVFSYYLRLGVVLGLSPFSITTSLVTEVVDIPYTSSPFHWTSFYNS